MTDLFRPSHAVPVATLFSLAVALGGCSMIHHDPGAGAACPKARFVPELAQLSRFTGDNANFNNLVFKASVSQLSGKCSFATDKSVTIDASFDLTAERGPAGEAGNPAFPYFVVIQAPDGGIVSKTIFPAPLPFKPGQSRAGSRETVEETFFIPGPKLAVDYTIFIGLQLTQAENDYNTLNHVGE